MVDQKQTHIQKKSHLFFGEGAEDRAFLCHLKDVFVNKSTHYIKLEKGFGGSPVDVVKEALKHSDIGYDLIIVVIDGDRPQQEYNEIKKLIKGKNLKVIIMRPCMESVLLSILEPGKKWHSKKTDHCKSRFEREYVSAKHRTNPKSYVKHFPKKVISEARSRIPELDGLVRHITE